MAAKITVLFGSREIELVLLKRGNLLEALQEADLHVPAVCGMHGVCGKCAVQVVKGRLDITPADEKYFTAEQLEAGNRLSCMAYPTEDLTIILNDANESEFSAVSYFEHVKTLSKGITVDRIELEKTAVSFAKKVKGDKKDIKLSLDMLAECSKLADNWPNAVFVAKKGDAIVHISENDGDFYGIGIDIGTTTIAFGLVNLISGEMIGNLTVVNKQRDYGADVITRILKAVGGELKTLGRIVRKQLSDGISSVCESNGVDSGRVLKVAIAGNTTMLHLLMEFSCNTLGGYPFTPVALEFMSFRYKDLFDGDLICDVDILPGISTYVGADITAGILLSDLLAEGKPSFLLDIGTNGEMAVSRDGKLFCTSTAAGPAFEGGNILWGTGSVPGAISKAEYVDGKFDVSTIADQPPVGICGSGVIDLVYECLHNGLIDNTGRLAKQYRDTNSIFVASAPDKKDITFTQKDIRELQLGKSAIRSGIELLLKFAGLTYDDIDTLYIAGGFGYKINFEKATGLGLIPQELRSKISLIGNSSLGGAIKYLLNEDCLSALNNIIDVASEHNLSEDKLFNDMFIDNMLF